MTTDWAAVEVVPCFDAECSGTAEVEQDGDLSFYVCKVCGSEFGYERLPTAPVAAAGAATACQLGVPEDVRRRASAPALAAQAALDPAQGKPLLQIGRRPQ